MGYRVVFLCYFFFLHTTTRDTAWIDGAIRTRLRTCLLLQFCHNLWYHLSLFLAANPHGLLVKWLSQHVFPLGRFCPDKHVSFLNSFSGCPLRFHVQPSQV